MNRQDHFHGKHLHLRSIDGWEYVERSKASGVVAVLAITGDRKILLVEQYRPPVRARVIEIPAGLAGDIAGAEEEALELAARRELLEETGYDAEQFDLLTEGPSSAGLTTETITFFRARGLKKTHAGGGDAGEDITVHEIGLDQLDAWIEGKRGEGCLVDYKIYAALYFEPRRE